MWTFPPNFKPFAATTSSKKTYQIYLYRIGYGGSWLPLTSIEASDEDEALKLAADFRVLQEGEMYKAEESF